MTVYVITYTDYLEDLRVWSYDDREVARTALEVLPNGRTAFVVEGEADLLTEAGRGPILKDLYNRLSGAQVARFESILIGLHRLFVEVQKRAVAGPTRPRLKEKEVEETTVTQEAPTSKRGRSSQFRPEQVITVVSEKNPKKAGTAAHALFAKYQSGMTVKEFLDAGGSSAALIWDSNPKRNFIKID